MDFTFDKIGPERNSPPGAFGQRSTVFLVVPAPCCLECLADRPTPTWELALTTSSFGLNGFHRSSPCYHLSYFKIEGKGELTS